VVTSSSNVFLHPVIAAELRRHRGRGSGGYAANALRLGRRCAAFPQCRSGD
jgi:hypothetical protein